MAYVTKPFLGNSGDPVVRTPLFHCRVQFLIEELRSHKLQGDAKKERESDKAILGSFWGTPNPSA